MDNQVIKEEIQIRPVELQFKSEIKNQKGARKTMPSVRKKHTESGLMKSRLINLNGMPSGINTASERMSTVLTIGFSPVASTSNSTSFTTSENNFDASETRTPDSINSDKQIEKENSLELTHKKKSNKTLSSQTKRNSLESERKIYGKRPIESGDLSNIDSQKISVKTSSLPENYDCEVRKDANSNVSIDERNINNYTYAEIEYPNEIIDRPKSVFLPLQSRENVNSHENVKKSAGSKPLKKIQNFGRTNKRVVKIVRFFDKENENSRQAFKTQLQDVNTTRRHFPVKQVPRILLNQNMKGSSSRTLASQNILEEKKQGNTLKLHLGKNMPVTGVRNMNETRPVCYQLPTTFKTFKNTFPLPRYSFQAHTRRRGMIGTATRDTEQNMSNLRVIFPQQLRMQYNLASKTADHINAGHPPFAVSRIETGAEGKKHSLRISNDFCYATTAENNRKQSKSENQTSAERSQANPERRRESQIFTPPEDTKSLNPLPSAETGVLDNSAKVRQASNYEVESEVEDRIQVTKMTLTKISELLQNINKELLCGFECRGLELSLPIWREELEQCILSVEKVKSVISEYQDLKK